MRSNILLPVEKLLSTCKRRNHPAQLRYPIPGAEFRLRISRTSSNVSIASIPPELQEWELVSVSRSPGLLWTHITAQSKCCGPVRGVPHFVLLFRHMFPPKLYRPTSRAWKADK